MPLAAPATAPAKRGLATLPNQCAHPIPGGEPSLAKLTALARAFQGSCLAHAAKLLKQAPTESSASAQAPGVHRIPVQNPRSLHPELEEIWGARTVTGMNPAGRYEPAAGPHPATHLQADGTGIFEMRGTTGPEQICLIRWWILCAKDGSPISREYPQATAYALVVEYVGRPYQGRTFDRYGLIVGKNGGPTVLLDRVKQSPIQAKRGRMSGRALSTKSADARSAFGVLNHSLTA
jgi:hypothetical protein